jgi:hypothetical protein
VGIFICDHGARWGVKKWRHPDWAVPKTPKWLKSVRMEEELDFWYDPDDMRVVVKYPCNPGAAFKSIELAMTRHIVNEGGRHDVVFDGLWVRYGAAHGFGGGSTRNITIRNCDICWIGGGLQFWRRHEKTGKVLYPVRFGNGIEFWGNCAGNLVERNRLWEIYDAALTNQGRNDEGSAIPPTLSSRQSFITVCGAGSRIKNESSGHTVIKGFAPSTSRKNLRRSSTTPSNGTFFS